MLVLLVDLWKICKRLIQSPISQLLIKIQTFNPPDKFLFIKHV